MFCCRSAPPGWQTARTRSVRRARTAIRLPRDGELQQAVAAARNAVGLYHDALDYQSSAVMQFNVAATLHKLGDQAAAVQALQSAIALDREYGFRDDAEDNTRLLLRWTNGSDGDSAVADLMKDFPARSAEFKFNWSDSDADVAIDADETNVTGDKTVQSKGAIVLKRHVRADLRSWAVSYEPGTATFDLGDWTGENNILRRFTAYLLASALIRAPKIEVYRTGDFEYAHDAHEFGETLSAEVTARLGDGTKAQGEPAGSSLALAENLKSVFSPQFVDADAAEKYSIETATWIGARLQQRVWYQMSAPLFLPGLGMGQFLVTHDIEFSYARQVACTAGDPDRSCAEIVVHATPDAKDLQLARDEVAHSLRLPGAQSLHYWSTTDMRLVVRPDTLVPYVSDTRRYWYVALDGGEKGDPVISSESIVAASAYH